jgi:hypothetical protein
LAELSRKLLPLMIASGALIAIRRALNGAFKCGLSLASIEGCSKERPSGLAVRGDNGLQSVRYCYSDLYSVGSLISRRGEALGVCNVELDMRT